MKDINYSFACDLCGKTAISETDKRHVRWVTLMKENRQRIADSITWVYSGQSKGYHIKMSGAGAVHFTRSERERDMFIAELKAKIIGG